MHLAPLFSEENKLWNVNSQHLRECWDISQTQHRHTWICRVELALKREFALHILDRKCADIKYGAHIFILANSKCHLTTFKEAGKLIHFQPKDNFRSCFPWIFLFENPLRFLAEESLLIFRWCKSHQDYGLRVASVGKGRDAINLCELKYTSFH